MEDLNVRVRRIESLDPVKPYTFLPAFLESPYICLLESSGDPDERGRYDFLCAEPFYVFESKRGRAWGGPPGELVELPGRPLDELKALLARYRISAGPPSVPAAPPFLGGLVGYVGYEMLYEIEEIPDLGLDDKPMPDCVLGLYDTVIAHDRFLQRTWLIVNGFGADRAQAEGRVEQRLAEVKRKLAEAPPPVTLDGDALRALRAEIKAKGGGRLNLELMRGLGIEPVCSREQYLEIVHNAKEHIFAGDIFEVCTTQRFDTTFDGEGIELFQVLREVSGAPFSSYLRAPAGEVISSSPERFLRVDWQRWVETRPMKGTRPRGATPAEDEALRMDLATNEKDRAELVMITDLARNDLGRVCEFNTVEVLEEAVIEAYPFTFQRVATISGLLGAERDAVDLLRAAFPGGSMTGAPKVESMKIIDALEPVKRGVFSGGVGYIDFDGALDLNIVIRTLIKKGNSVNFHVGGAIVADSDPVEEYQETLDKAHGMVIALEIARHLRA